MDQKIQKIRELMARAGLKSQQDLSKLSGVHPITISKIFTGKTKDPHGRTVQTIIDKLTSEILRRQGNPPFDLEGDTADPSKQSQSKRRLGIPIVSDAQAGDFVDYEVDIHADEYLPFSLFPFRHLRPASFIVRGTSMTPLIKPGDVAVVARKLRQIQNDDIIVCALKQGGGHTLKMVRILSETEWELIPKNEAEHSRMIVKVADIAWWVPVVGVFSPIWKRRSTPYNLK